jgi:6-phosphogluconate dehydrogenase
MTTNLSDIGLVGLAVMGQNLALNIADHGYKISVYNRTTAKTKEFVAQNPNTPGGLVLTETVQELVASLQKPRKIIILVKAGAPTDAVIDELVPHLEAGDVVIDGGNAHWLDTLRRENTLKAKGLCFVGCGVSGGEEGARFGPSLMPGGDPKAWEALAPIWKAIAAKVDPVTGQEMKGATPGKPIQGGIPCTAYMGTTGAGHYVKMVHNGIEYGDMQMICEAYHLMKDLLGLKPEAMAETFREWNKGILNSFLVEVAAEVLAQKDPETGNALVDMILDVAGQKGTGKWTSMNALDMGVPAPTFAEAVFARCMSAVKDERVAASKILKGPTVEPLKADPEWIQAIHDALYCAKICSYAQGFQLMATAQKIYDWKLDFGSIAQIWRGGCIIRASFLQKITEAYEKNPGLANLLLDPYFTDTLHKAQSHWRKVVALAATHGIPVPTFSSALAYFDSYRLAQLPQNLLQGQRDYFGAHTYERIDKPRGEFYHLDWPHPNRPQVKV